MRSTLCHAKPVSSTAPPAQACDSFTAASHWRSLSAVVVERGSSTPRPLCAWRSKSASRSANKMLVGVRLTCTCNRLPAAQLALVFWPFGKPETVPLLYSPSKLSENQARPLTMGPETPARGVQSPKRTPEWMSMPGMKLVAVEWNWSAPVSGWMARVPAEPLPTLADSRESANVGNGSAGTLAIQPETGADQFHSTATNFIPGIDIHSGVRFGDWTPRAGVSGPIVKGRAWFSDSFDGEYNSGTVSGLPNGQNTNASWAAGNLLHVQVNLTPTNILFADLLADFDHQARNGLGVLDPLSTTTALSDRQWLAAAKESHAWAGGAVLETGFAWQSVDRDRTPQGELPYIVAPAGRGGDYFEIGRA